MAQAKEILIVDDEVGIRELLSEILEDEGYRVALAENASEARAYRQRQQPALVLLDIWMPDTDGVTLLREWATSGQLTMPVVMMSGHGTIETAVDATKVGAFDFLEKPIGLQKLLSTIARALKNAAVQEPRRVSLTPLGASNLIRETERALEQMIAGRRPILILGEPGTGHDLAARAVATPDAPCLALVNGARLTSNPLALLEEAREGTLYCAEIGQYSKIEQKGLAFLLPKLDKQNVTLVCTSSEPLGNLAAEGKFDAALLAQLSSGTVMLPPLRKRREDIPPLIERYWREANKDEAPTPLLTALPPAALTALSNAYWPGNLDHLAGFIQNLSLRARRGDDRACQARAGRSGNAQPLARARDHGALLRAPAARGARGVRAHLLRAASRPRAEQHEQGRGAGRARAHASLPQVEAAQHPVLARVDDAA